MALAEPRETAAQPLLTLGLVLSTIMVGLDTTIANVALPHVMGSLSTSADQITWVLTSYIVASAIVTPLTGWLEARVGRKTVFMVAIIGFVGASMLCGIADSLPEIVAFRLLQGVFSAPMVPLAQAQLLDMNPPERHGPAMALFGMGSLLGPISGPALGGFLTEHYSWRWVFYINLPIGILDLLLVGLLMSSERPARRRRFDFIGFGMLAVFIGAFQLLLDRGPSQDWFSSVEIWSEAIVAAIALWVFVTFSATARSPFFDRRIIADRSFLAALALSIFVFLLMGSSLALVAPLLQTLLGYPVQTAGLVMLPRGFGTMLGSFVVGRLVTRFDSRLLLLFGLAFLALSAWQMSRFDLAMDSQPILMSGALQGFGMGIIMVPITVSAFATLPASLRAEASGLLAVVRYMSQSTGISVFQALLTHNTQAMHASLAAHVVATDPVVRSTLTAATDPAAAAGAVALDAEISRQAAMVAYVDDFKLMLILAVVCMPFVLIMRSPRQARGETIHGID